MTPGLRTHIMVGMGAALFTIVGAELGVDRTRMAAQVVSGIGFIGAGTIFRAGDSIKGLTTAAGMWTVAGIGVAAGFGMLLLATTATVVALVVLFGLLPVVDRIGSRNTATPKSRRVRLGRVHLGVDAPAELPTIQTRRQVLDRSSRHCQPRPHAGRPQVGYHDAVGHRHQRMVDGDGLGVGDIEGGPADAPRGEGLGQSIVINQSAPGNIHQGRSRASSS